ncbi:hypothetical protein ASPVEDRAFT_204692 [Aspergillus versicolor CBS 583.65]|uniref:F-box domain-containing protein n=1 Tax=Aspergillus versicolor CBS 583.65 TaxID=1036611 RepID=A0A1L9Q4Z6_ASPVE|nr:uncharacterized protein ASPVEDRAFT_204692 [Aspergillus versicolor CBS 583.65]OJJ08837.1 hypothetical protein ASPVEDRAFT_204692 [Aspergillus versicolor CBS 583.65]
MENKVTLDELPAELILDIGHQLSMGDLNSLVRTAKRFDIVLSTRLYRLGAEFAGKIIPLIWAVKNNRISVVRRLLDQGADPASQEAATTTALHWAVKQLRLRVLRMLLRPGVETFVMDRKDSTPLQLAAIHPRLGALEIMLDVAPAAYPDANEDWATALEMAVLKGRLRHARLLLETAAKNIERPAQKALEGTMLTAARTGNRAMIELLVKFGWDNWGAVEATDSTPLYAAVEKNDEDIVKMLIQYGSNVNAVEGNGETALHIATRRYYFNIMKVLLEAGADVSIVDESQNTALHLSSCGRESSKPVTELLLDSGADIHARNNVGNTALHVAADAPTNVSVVRLLIERGSDVKAANNNGKTPLFMAARRGSLPIVNLLLSCGAHVNIERGGDLCPLTAAADSNHAHLLQPLVDAGFELNPVGLSPMMVAADSGHAEAMRELIRLGADINHTIDETVPRSPIDRAIRSHNLEAVRVLLEAGAPICKPGYPGESILHSAVHAGATVGIVELLIQHRADVHALEGLNQNALHTAVRFNRRILIRPLAAGGVPIDAPDANGNRPIHLAVEHRGLSCRFVEPLITARANISARGDQGLTALHTAIKKACYRSRKLLIEAGADVGAEDILGRTPLHLGAARGHKPTFQLLLDVARQKSVPLTAQSAYGLTVIEEAAAAGNTSILQMLSDENLDITGSNPSQHGNHRGMPPVHMATIYGREATAKHLISRGADPHVIDVYGRTAMDWAMLHQSDNLTSQLHRHNFIYAPLTTEARTAVLKESIVGLARRVLDNVAAVFYQLAKCLQFIDNMPAAATVWSFGLAQVSCDQCDMALPLNGPRFVCSQCPEMDFCVGCHGDDGSNLQNAHSACLRHGLAEVDLGGYMLPEQRGEAPDEGALYQARRAFLKGLIEQYSQ